MRKYFYFIRHGECLSNLDPHFSGQEDSLSESGMSQAVSVANRFKRISVDAIYHSGVLRAQKTAEEVEKVTGVSSESKEFLKERGGAFSSEGVYGYTEDFAQLKYRLSETRKLLEVSDKKHTVIVGHAIFLKALAAYLIIGEALNENLLKSFDDGLVMDNTGISKFMFNEEKNKWRMMLWNDTIHLEC